MTKSKKDCKSTNQKIKCDVSNCTYNNTEDSLCNLEEIKVSCNCNKEDATNKKETICDSFECDCDKEEDSNQKE